jgi:hypothetical protein
MSEANGRQSSIEDGIGSHYDTADLLRRQAAFKVQ